MIKSGDAMLNSHIEKRAKRKFTDRYQALLFLAPALLTIGFVFLFPVAKLIQYSFQVQDYGQWKWVGLANYQGLFKDDVFLQAVRNNAVLLLCVPVLIALSIFFAILLYEKIRGWQAYRSIVFLPYLLAIPVVGIVFSYIFQYNGILNEILRSLGLERLALDWLADSKLALPTVMLVIIWKELGFGVVLFLSRLLSVPEELYEAAKLDGASWWQTHWHITIPQLRDVIQFYSIVAVITMLSWVFNYVYVMTKGGPGTSTMVSELYIYQQGFRFNLMGSASAVGVILLVVTSLVIYLQFKIKGVDSDEA